MYNLNHNIWEMDDVRSQGQTGWRVERRLTAPDLKITRPRLQNRWHNWRGKKPVPCLKKWKWAECQQEGIFCIPLGTTEEQEEQSQRRKYRHATTHQQQWVAESEGGKILRWGALQWPIPVGWRGKKAQIAPQPHSPVPRSFTVTLVDLLI